MGIKINNRTKLPALSPVDSGDYFPITDANTGKSKTVSVSGLNAGLTGVKRLTGTVSDSSTFQSNALEGVTTILSIHLNGVELISGGFFDSFNSTNGTITFTSNQTGTLNINYA